MKNNRETRMQRVRKLRGRTPIKATAKEIYIKVEKTNKLGVKHSNYKKVLVKN